MEILAIEFNELDAAPSWGIQGCGGLCTERCVMVMMCVVGLSVSVSVCLHSTSLGNGANLRLLRREQAEASEGGGFGP